jgi:hypothetical protein
VIRGGFVVWRAAQWYPDLVTHVFSVCTPYTAPHKEYFSTEDLVKGQLPQFAYQLHLASGEVEKSVKDEQSIRQFLKGLYGARGANGELAFDPEKGVLAENLPKIGESKILNGKVSDRSPAFHTLEDPTAVRKRMTAHQHGYLRPRRGSDRHCGCSTPKLPHLWKQRGSGRSSIRTGATGARHLRMLPVFDALWGNVDESEWTVTQARHQHCLIEVLGWHNGV